MEKGDKPKSKPSNVAKPSKNPVKTEKAKTIKRRPKKRVGKASQIVKVNINIGKDGKDGKPIRKEISKQTTYLTLEKPYALTEEEEDKLTITKFIPIPPKPKSSVKVSNMIRESIQQPAINLIDYIANTDDAKISNPNTGEIINIENEPELEDEFGLSSSQVLGYTENDEIKPIGTTIGMIESLEKRRVGRPSKYGSEEERKAVIREQKRQSKARIEEERITRAKERVNIEYESFLEGDNAFQYTDLEKDLLTDVVIPERKFAKAVVEEFFKKAEKGEQISSDFISSLVDKTSESNNFNLIQSNIGDKNENLFE